ncbi:tetratricopeptide repeat protein [Nocardioides sp. MH1]|uniref:tetratricopeptide repeat protein n=1 Tax=Nocardioides sp. MH1 TaxID=3242490 RepID=UPI0035221154
MSPEGAASLARVRHLIEVDRFAEARSELEAAIARDPDAAELHGLLARALLGLGDAPGALRAASRLVQLDPDDDWGHRLCSVALKQTGRPHEALAAAGEAVRLSPSSWQTHLQYANAALDVYGRLLDALSAAQRAVELAPNEPNAHHVLGLVHAQRREDELARAAYLRTLQLAPDHAAARNNLAVLDGGLRLGRQTRGFLAALRADPQSQVVQQNLEIFLPTLFLRIWLAFGAGLVVALLVTIHGDSPDESDPGPASYAILALLLLGCGGYVASLVRHLPSRVLRELWRRQRRSFLAWWDMVATAVLVAAVAAVCVVPGAGELGIHMLRPLFLGLIIVSIATYVQRQNR